MDIFTVSMQAEFNRYGVLRSQASLAIIDAIIEAWIRK